MKSLNKAGILMGMALLAGLAIVSVSVTGCTTVTNEGTLTINGWLWTRAGRMTDKIGETKPVLLEGAYLAPAADDFSAEAAAPAHPMSGPAAAEADPLERMAP